MKIRYAVRVGLRGMDAAADRIQQGGWVDRLAHQIDVAELAANSDGGQFLAQHNDGDDAQPSVGELYLAEVRQFFEGGELDIQQEQAGPKSGVEKLQSLSAALGHQHGKPNGVQQIASRSLQRASIAHEQHEIAPSRGRISSVLHARVFTS